MGTLRKSHTYDRGKIETEQNEDISFVDKIQYLTSCVAKPQSLGHSQASAALQLRCLLDQSFGSSQLAYANMFTLLRGADEAAVADIFQSAVVSGRRTWDALLARNGLRPGCAVDAPDAEVNLSDLDELTQQDQQLIQIAESAGGLTAAVARLGGDWVAATAELALQAEQNIIPSDSGGGGGGGSSSRAVSDTGLTAETLKAAGRPLTLPNAAASAGIRSKLDTTATTTETAETTGRETSAFAAAGGAQTGHPASSSSSVVEIPGGGAANLVQRLSSHATTVSTSNALAGGGGGGGGGSRQENFMSYSAAEGPGEHGAAAGYRERGAGREVPFDGEGPRASSPPPRAPVSLPWASGAKRGREESISDPEGYGSGGSGAGMHGDGAAASARQIQKPTPQGPSRGYASQGQGAAAGFGAGNNNNNNQSNNNNNHSYSNSNGNHPGRPYSTHEDPESRDGPGTDHRFESGFYIRAGSGAPDPSSSRADRDGAVGSGSMTSSGLPGFQTARTKLVMDLAKKGQSPPSFSSGQGSAAAAAYRPGLARPPAAATSGRRMYGGGGAGPAGNAQPGRGGFVPPFLTKAVQGPGHGGGGGGGGGGGDGESALPPRLLEMLEEKGQLGPDGSVPEVIARLDPRIVEAIFNEVLDRGGAVDWADIAGQDHAKRMVQEMVVWPIMNPQLFKGARAPPRGLLLFGPPGTGKTLIGRAVAANIRATFFSISASSLTSKWIGEGEKMVRALFALAGCLAPSVIFLDEIDSLLSARKSEGEHESSRRLKTELLVQMEGCDPASQARRLLLVGATNRPEELDEAARRRMPKQLYIPLPCDAARRQMLERQMLRPEANVAHCLSSEDVDRVVGRTRGYSGSDMRCLIQEACQGPVRDLFRSRGDVTGASADMLRPAALADFKVAMRAQKASVSAGEIERYEKYDKQFGARSADMAGDGAADDDDDDW